MLSSQNNEQKAGRIPSYKALTQCVQKMPHGALVAEYFLTASEVYLFCIAKRAEPQAFRIPITVLPDPVPTGAAPDRSRGTGVDPHGVSLPPGELVEALFPAAKSASIVYLISHRQLDHYALHATRCREGNLLDYAPVVYLPSLAFAPSSADSAQKGGRALVMGNMTGDLSGAETEAEKVAEILGTSPLLREK